MHGPALCGNVRYLHLPGVIRQPVSGRKSPANPDGQPVVIDGGDHFSSEFVASAELKTQ
jgi:hypothetical protein